MGGRAAVRREGAGGQFAHVLLQRSPRRLPPASGGRRRRVRPADSEVDGSDEGVDEGGGEGGGQAGKVRARAGEPGPAGGADPVGVPEGGPAEAWRGARETEWKGGRDVGG